MLGPAQQHWGVVLGGYPSTWMANLRSYLESPKGGYRLIRNFGTATLLKARAGGT
jgi:hypothetical protein